MRGATPALLGLVVTLVLVSCLVGTAPLSIGETLIGAVQAGSTIETIVWQIRLPRALSALVTGMALGAAGAALQGLLRNPLAGPGVLGVSASAGLGAVIVLYFGLAGLGGWVVPAGAIAGAFVAMAVLLVATRRAAGPVGMILVGLGLSSFAGALISLAMNLAPTPFALSEMVNWLLGSVTNRSFDDLSLIILPMAGGAGLIFAAARGLRALSLGEDVAFSLGADPKRTRYLVIGGAGLLVGASVALAGTIGFVGIIAPHAMRMVLGGDPARLIWPSALGGGVLLLGADLMIRAVPAMQGLNLGVMAALVGAPVFIWIAASLAKGWR